MITVLLSIVLLILQAFGINVIQDGDAMCLAAILELAIEFLIGMVVVLMRMDK